MPMHIICDLDGTLYNVDHRLPYITKLSEPDWDTFNRMCVADSIITNVQQLVQDLVELGHSLIIMTGRSERYQLETRGMLRRDRIPYDTLHMRPLGDRRSDAVLKAEWSRLYPPAGVLAVLEDRDRVVQMWRERGYTCWQPCIGAY